MNEHEEDLEVGTTNACSEEASGRNFTWLVIIGSPKV